ncbi:MAG: hypothetical protein MUC53_01070 [Candidatus Contendobacter sp.]|jgi:hypothetical protein|nr:hypothetical protein [Candidatus Contendobacter sp.]
MSTMTSYIPGPANLHDWGYEAFSARKDAEDAAIESRIEEMENLPSWRMSAGQELMQAAMEKIADSSKQEWLNRWLFQVWQYRDKKEATDKKVLAFAVGQVANIINDALVAVVTAEIKRR